MAEPTDDVRGLLKAELARRGIDYAELARLLDLHGLTHDAARARLISFLIQAREEGYRAALVITGKGKQGDGVLRRFAPEWLASHDLRGVVAGVSEAHRKHGGEGALYVALKSR